MWKLRTCKAICDTNIKPKSATKKLKSTNSWSKDREETWESQGESQLKNILILLTCRRIGKLQKRLPLSYFSSCSVSFQWLFWKDAQARHYPTALKSYKSHRPRPKHQALAPSSPMLFLNKSIFVNVLLTFNASARACGQKRWQTMWKLRTCKAICDTCPTPLKSPKSGTNGAYCVPLQNKRSQGLCHGCKRYPRQCVVSKAWHVQMEDAFLVRWRGGKNNTCRNMQQVHCLYKTNCEKTCVYPQLQRLKNTFGGTSFTSTKVKKVLYKKLYSTTHRRFAKLPKPMTLQISKKSAGSTTVQHPFRGLEPQTPRPKHQALAPSSPIWFLRKSIFVNVLLTFNASARACGQKRWQTMWNLRTYKAICHNIAMSTTTHWSLAHEVKIKRWKKHCSISISVKISVNILCIYLLGIFL